MSGKLQDTFRKGHGDGAYGYTEEEAFEKIASVNDSYGVFSEAPRWYPATAIPDSRGGWMVIIESI